MSTQDLRLRSVRTLAWLGDAEFEREVRLRSALRGDYPTERLDAVKAMVVCAPAQAALLERIIPELDDDEQAVVRRARNTRPPPSARRRGSEARTYRAATALEALVAVWHLGDGTGTQRFTDVLVPALEQAIDDAFQRTARKR